MIHVCFSVYDPSGHYSKYAGVAMESMLSHTESEVTLHLLHDATLTDDNRRNFVELVQNHGQSICFYEISDETYRDFAEMTTTFSVGTLFRLSLPEVLPQEIQTAIYLDADVIVNMDIAKLWAEDLHGAAIGATAHEGWQGDHPVEKPCAWPCSAGMVSPEQYFNAGVLVLDLAKIRAEHDLRQESLQFLAAHPQCTMSDQDALNVLFRDDYARLPQRYNLFTRLRPKDETVAPEGIIHVSGAFLDPEMTHWWDRLFVEHWRKTPWWTGDEVAHFMRSGLELLGRQIRLCRYHQQGGKIVFWGSANYLYQKLLEFFAPDAKRDYFVNQKEFWQARGIDGMRVYPPEKVLEEQAPFVVIVLGIRSREEMCQWLTENGFREHTDFFDVRDFLRPGEGGITKYY